MESPSSEHRITDAPPPFNNATADTFLRTSDRVDFRVHSVILAEASPFFGHMFGLPQPIGAATQKEDSDDCRDGRPVIAVTENSKTLENLLRLCYPIADPVLADLADVEAVLEAAVKYEMEHAISMASKKLRSFAAAEPLRVWAIACRLRLEEEAWHAAEHMLRLSILDSFPREMHEVSAGAYFRLLRFCRMNGSVGDSFIFCNPPLPRDDERDTSESSTETQPVDFYAHPFVDVIFRSLDGVDFRVHQVVLSLASPVLRDMFSKMAPEQPSASHDDLMTLDLPEDSQTLVVLFKLCYPLSDANAVVVANLALIDAVTQAAAKYKMKRVADIVRNAWDEMSRLQQLKSYLIVARSKLTRYAQEAARHSLTRVALEEEYEPELERSPAFVYYQLLKYRIACRAVVAEENGRLDIDALWKIDGQPEDSDDDEESSDEESQAEDSSSQETPVEGSSSRDEKQVEAEAEEQSDGSSTEGQLNESSGEEQTERPPKGEEASSLEEGQAESEESKGEAVTPAQCSCGESVAMRARRKLCHKCAREWIYEKVTEAMGKTFKTSEEEKENDCAVLIRSLQQGCWCTECEPIATFMTRADAYVLDKVKEVLSEVKLERP